MFNVSFCSVVGSLIVPPPPPDDGLLMLQITSHPSSLHCRKQRPFVNTASFRSPSYPCDSVLRNADGGRKVIF